MPFPNLCGAALFRRAADPSLALGGVQRTAETDNTLLGLQTGQGIIGDPLHKRGVAYAVEAPSLRATASLVQWRAWYTNI